MTMPERGEAAPDIDLPDEAGTIHRLADQRGRWTIVYFYPADDTPGCTTEACQFRDLNDDVHDVGADVWGISPDGAASHRLPREVRLAVHPPVGRGSRRCRSATVPGS
jgi:peroxiredoxin Q/BCP